MFENTYNNNCLILKRNDEEERKLNYTKIYDLSIIDTIPYINQEQKYSILIEIKKILLCTNKYIEICNIKEIFNYILMSIVIFIIYAVFFSPSIQIYLLTEQQSNDLQYFTFTKKFFYYNISQFVEIIFRLCFNYYRKKITNKIFLFYARNELKKIQDDFVIDIDENNFDLIISKYKYKYYDNKFENSDENEEINFYQYVICYPNVRYYDWDQKILNEKEKIICNLIKSNIRNIEDNFILKYSFSVAIIIVLYIVAFYFLTLANVIIYFILMFILFSFTKIISIILSNHMKKSLIINEELLSMLYMSQGYLISFSTNVILIFKLKGNYENCDINYLNDIYKKFYKQIIIINEKCRSF